MNLVIDLIDCANLHLELNPNISTIIFIPPANEVAGVYSDP